MLRHADTSVCSPEVHDFSHHTPPTLRQLSVQPHTVSIGCSGAYPSSCCAPNRRSNPIAHRVRRKRQRLPPSLLIENASERFPLPTRSVVSRRFRSRLATTRQEGGISVFFGTRFLRRYWRQAVDHMSSNHEYRVRAPLAMRNCFCCPACDREKGWFV